MKKVWILCGVPGSGKSTYARTHLEHATWYSADDYFMIDGEYRFNPNRLADAHGQCLRRFVAAVQSGVYEIVVDNTNTTVAEIAPYAALALAYGYQLEVVTIMCEPAVAHARNTHGVPLSAVEGMHARLMSRELPLWWKHTRLESVNAREFL